MEAIVFLLILFAVFRSVGKKAGQTAQKPRRVMMGMPMTEEDSAEEPQPSEAPKQKRRRQPQQMESEAPRKQAYQPMKPRVEARSRLYDYTGSLGYQSHEGESSMEGEDTCDDSLMHGHAALEAQYAPRQERPNVQPLPSFASADALVQGFVMSEILGQPKGFDA